ncbi:MAG: CHAT domain-containing protein [Candidatus Krumholzibacteriota bacterium]|nr:CHAT domain-containing protein [Candidatus Krumholzibacteriota bacterium]
MDVAYCGRPPARRLAALLCLLALLAGAAGGEQGAADSLAARVDSLREAGEYRAAAGVARELLALRRADAATPPFAIVDLEWTLRTLEHCVAAGAAARARLAEADSLGALVVQNWRRGRYADGAALARRRLDALRAALPAACPEVAAGLHDLATLLRAQGEYADGEAAFREALALRESLLGAEHPDVASTLNGLAALLYADARYGEAESLYRRALAIQRRALGDESLDVARTLNNLAALLEHEGDYAEAEAGYREALALRRRLLGEEHRLVASGLNNLAGVLLKQGDYAAAKPLYRRALAMQRRLLGEDHPEVAAGLNNLAFLMRVQGDLERAEPLQREALAVCRRAYGGDHPLVARSLNNLALVLQAREDYAGAEPLLRDALAMRRRLLGDRHPDVANGMSSLAANLQLAGAYAEAESLFTAAIVIRRDLLGDANPDVARAVARLADLHRARGDAAVAAPLYEEALAVRRAALGEAHPEVVANLRDLGLVRAATGDLAAAESLLARAAGAYDAARLRAGREYARSTFTRSPWAELAAARLLLGRQEDAWPAAEKALARSLADLLMTAGGRGLDPSEAAREDSLKRALGDAERRLAVFVGAAAGDTSALAGERAARARQGLLAAEAAWSAFHETLAAAHPLAEGASFPLARVQAALGSDAALVGWIDVELVAGAMQSWGYVVRRAEPVAWAPLPDAGGTAPRTAAFRRSLADRGSPAIGIAREGRGLWNERFAPLADVLAKVRDLVVVPSGPMLGIPVETLVDGEGALLGERFAVSYAPSATVHAWLAERSGSRDARAGRPVLVLGDPPFDGMMPRLERTREEAAAVAALAPGATLLLGEHAAEAELLRLAASGELAGFGTIHLATHALIDDALPERSALVLSQAGLGDPVAAAVAGERVCDGLLTASEIVREWRIDADLVVLSACETGLGRQVLGEGYLGLANAFLRAGARSLVVSLWRVEDRSTALLMERFHANRRGAGASTDALPAAEALREAKRWLRTWTDDAGRTPYAHPFYWSAFILIGAR